MALLTVSLVALSLSQAPFKGTVILAGAEIPADLAKVCLAARTLDRAKSAIVGYPATVEMLSGINVFHYGDPGRKDHAEAVAQALRAALSKEPGRKSVLTLGDFGTNTKSLVKELCGTEVPYPQFGQFGNAGEIKCTLVPAAYLSVEIAGKTHTFPTRLGEYSGKPDLRINQKPSENEATTRKPTLQLRSLNGILISYSSAGLTSEKVAVAGAALLKLSKLIAIAESNFKSDFQKLCDRFGTPPPEIGTAFGRLPPAIQERLRLMMGTKPEFAKLKDFERDALLQSASIVGVRPSFELGFRFNWPANEPAGGGVFVDPR